MLNGNEPTAAERSVLQKALTQLSNMDVLPAREEYDVGTLASAIYGIGGAYSIDRPQHPMHLHPRGEGVGWDAESALLFAVVQAVPRMYQHALPNTILGESTQS